MSLFCHSIPLPRHWKRYMCVLHAQQTEFLLCHPPVRAGEGDRHEHKQSRDAAGIDVEHSSILQSNLAPARYHRGPFYTEELHTKRLDTGRYRSCLAAVCCLLLPVRRQRSLFLHNSGPGPCCAGHPGDSGDGAAGDERPCLPTPGTADLALVLRARPDPGNGSAACAALLDVDAAGAELSPVLTAEMFHWRLHRGRYCGKHDDRRNWATGQLHYYL